MVAASVFMQIAKDLPLNPIALTPMNELHLSLILKKKYFIYL